MRLVGDAHREPLDQPRRPGRAGPGTRASRPRPHTSCQVTVSGLRLIQVTRRSVKMWKLGNWSASITSKRNQSSRRQASANRNASR